MTKASTGPGRVWKALPRSHRSLNDIESLLAVLSRDEAPETVQRNLDLVRLLGCRNECIPLLRGVLNNVSLLERIAGRSYRHVNHFDKIVLIANDDLRGYRLTLHLWDPPYSATELKDELIHEHRFSFWSTILTGTLVSENYIHATEGQTFRQYRYIPEQRERTFADFYEFRGQVTLAKAEPHVKVAGDAYFLSAPSIHRIELPISNITCSMVLRGPRLRPYSNVFNTRYPEGDAKFGNVMFTPSELSERLEKLLTTLGARGESPPLAATGPSDCDAVSA